MNVNFFMRKGATDTVVGLVNRLFTGLRPGRDRAVTGPGPAKTVFRRYKVGHEALVGSLFAAIFLSEHFLSTFLDLASRSSCCCCSWCRCFVDLVEFFVLSSSFRRPQADTMPSS